MTARAPFYVDPGSDWSRINLVASLMGNPATAKQHPLERQATIVLAWLLDHSRHFADEFLRRWFSDIVAAVRRPRAIGARAWGTLLPLSQTGYLYPDLSVAGSDRSFQILVEVKIDAAIHHWPLEDGTRLYQPDAYWLSWQENYEAEREAQLRRVGTLTTSGPGIAESERQSDWVDLRWGELGAALDELLSAEEIEPEVAAVAKDVNAAVGELVLNPGRTKPDIEDPLLAWGHELLTDLGPALASLVPFGRIRRARPGIYDDYVGSNLYCKLDGTEVGLWLYVTGAEARYAPASHKIDCLWVARYGTWPVSLVDRLRRAGFVHTKDRAGYRAERLGIQVDTIRAAGGPAEQVSYVLDCLAQAISQLRGETVGPR